MKPEFMEQLGYTQRDTLVIINSDDFGMCHSGNEGTIRFLTEGCGTSASVMLPCPWRQGALKFWREHPQYSIGVELTLTSEWEHYRWGPLAPREKVPSLIDPEGYFWGNIDLFVQHVKAEEVDLEIRTQLDYVLAQGLEPSHCINHMGSLSKRPDLYETYVRALQDYKLPARSPKLQQNPGWPSIDAQVGFELYYMGMEDGKEEKLYEVLRGLKPGGLYELYPHCAVDHPEIRAITGYSRFIPEDPNSWKGRISDTELYCLPRVRKFFEDNGIKLIGWREVKNAIRKYH